MWEQFKTNVLSPARVVPVVGAIITAAVTAATGYLAANGMNLDPAVVTGIVAPIALGGLATVLNWQKGWQDYEKRGAANQGIVEEYDIHTDDYIPDVSDLDSEGVKAAEAELLDKPSRPPDQPDPKPKEPTS